MGNESLVVVKLIMKIMMILLSPVGAPVKERAPEQLPTALVTLVERAWYLTSTLLIHLCKVTSRN
jgi:hypothetical protein